ncbi:MAG: ABC transporter substrate-binding protein [Bacteroidota bacterium]|nr:ABC transporter substrate-binding protein [Bacteroidota bacterium]
MTTVNFCQEHYVYDSSVEDKFSLGLHLYRQNDIKGALDIFNFLLQQEPIHQRTTAAYIMAGKSLIKLKQYNASGALLQEFLKMFPDTRYTNDVRYSIAISKLMILDYYYAASQLFECLENTTDTILSNKAARIFEFILTEHLNIKQIHEFYNKFSKGNFKDLVGIILSEKVYRAGDHNYAKELVYEIGDNKRPSLYYGRIQALKKKLNSIVKLKIGAVLPLMKNNPTSPIKKIAEEILDGISFALEEFKNESKFNGGVSLIAYDDNQDTSTAKEKVHDLSKEDNVIAVIGSLYSDITFSCAVVAEKYRVPLLSPTASANGIASVGSYIFQTNTDYATRGKAMARYAVQKLGMNMFAIIASNELSGRAQAESFAREVKRLGGKIVAWETYSKGESDLSEQFLNIRRAGVKLSEKKYSPENTTIPLKAVQGIFLPIADSDEISIIASQMKYFNIDTKILGTNEWHNESQLLSQKPHLGEIVFLTDAFVDRNDLYYSDFKKKYLSGMKKNPSNYAIIGYDNAKLILSKIAEGATTREEMIAMLRRTKAYQGIQGKISFLNGRVNSIVQILKYSNGEIHRIAEILVD